VDDVYDRAREWVNEHCPGLEGEAYEAKLAEVAADLAAIDEAAEDDIDGFVRA